MPTQRPEGTPLPLTTAVVSTQALCPTPHAQCCERPGWQVLGASRSTSVLDGEGFA